MKEKALENEIKDYLFSKNIYYFKVHGSKFMVKGIPDIVCCVNGRFVGIEVKKPVNSYGQTEPQKVHERNIIKSGGIYILATSLEGVKKEIESLTEKQNC